LTIGSNATTLIFNDVVSSLLLEEMRQKNMEGHNINALFARGLSQQRNRSKYLSGRFKLRERSKSPGKFVKVCCRCGKEKTPRVSG
jgi:hypothetical protein